MIRVKLADATIKVGGAFQEKKDAIKASGARWNAQIKTWESAKSLKEWHITPYDIEQGTDAGNHVTKYGTHYSAAEWSGMQATHRAKAEVAATFRPQYQALKQELRNRLLTIGLKADIVERLARIIERGDLEFAVEGGRLQFSTPERAQEVRSIEAWYGDAVGQLTMNEIDAQQATEERLPDAFGMY